MRYFNDFMKKSLFACVLFVALTSLMACNNTKEECRYKKQTLDIRVEHAKWDFDSIARQFYFRCNVPEITYNMYNYGNWSLSREFNKGFPDAYQVALPMSVFKADTLTEPTIVYYTQHIDYRIGVGYVEIQLTNSDYLYSQENPETMYFRLQADTTTIDLTINQNDWQFDNRTRQYYYHFLLPEITVGEYDFGHWSIYREYNKGFADAYQVALPLSCYLTDTITNSPIVRYEEHIDYRVGIGYVDIQLTNSDYLYFQDLSGEFIKPEAMDFRLQLIY